MKPYEQNITFELNEKLSFEKGQEIDEMISISLDPDIVIQAYDDYVQIRGLILLSGEYHRQQVSEEDLDDVKTTENVEAYIEKVIQVDEDLASFSHRFPLDISVTKERIKDIEAVTVTIDAFDYDLINSQTLHVFASLHINGVGPESGAKHEKVASTEEVRDMHSIDQTTEQEKIEKEVEQTVIPLPEAKAKAKNNPPDIPQEDPKLTLIKTKTDLVEEKEAEAIEDNPTTTSDLQVKDKDSTIETIPNPESAPVDQESDSDEAIELTTSDNEEMQIELSEGKEDNDSAVKDVTFLTELFEEDTDSFTQMTIYIAQEDDSPESIAKRYDLPVLQLLKDNHLSADTIEAGQLIKIRQHSRS